MYIHQRERVLQVPSSRFALGSCTARIYFPSPLSVVFLGLDRFECRHRGSQTRGFVKSPVSDSAQGERCLCISRASGTTSTCTPLSLSEEGGARTFLGGEGLRCCVCDEPAPLTEIRRACRSGVVYICSLWLDRPPHCLFVCVESPLSARMGTLSHHGETSGVPMSARIPELAVKAPLRRLLSVRARTSEEQGQEVFDMSIGRSERLESEPPQSQSVLPEDALHVRL